jgi:CubicO group peptidase (beta-lactamase class C family)
MQITIDDLPTTSNMTFRRRLRPARLLAAARLAAGSLVAVRLVAARLAAARLAAARLAAARLVAARLAAAGLAAAGLAAGAAAASPAVPVPAPSTQPLAAASPTVPTPEHPLSSADLEAFVDGLMPTALDTAEVPGAVVVVVRDGGVLFEKGYGFSDYARRTPVDPKATLFRPGSVSKLFTWTAVMQLVEAGKLDLDVDVNRYLDFKVPSYRGAPVTLRQLMTHRAGFSETARDLLTFGKAPPPLGEVLKRYVPPRIFAPEEGPGYSNYGASLAGYIVERVSGVPFERYVQQRIFAPLGMTSSTFQQPLPPELAPRMSTGYQTRDHAGPGFEIVDMPPAGALSASGDDMAHFMIAHLQEGRYGDARVLSPQTARMMHTTLWKAFPDLNGNALGFYQQNINGHRVIAHGGDTEFFHSDLSLFLDDGVGLFVSVNGRGKDGQGEFIRDSLFHSFADRYFPAAASPPQKVDEATAKAHAAMIAGSYISSRGSHSTFLALVGLIEPTSVTANSDGSITTAPIGIEETFIEAQPFLWQQFNGHDRLQGAVKDGRVTRWSTDEAAPIMIYLRPGGFAGTGLERPLALASMALLTLTAVLWPVAAIVRWRFQRGLALVGARATAHRLTRICAALAVLAVALWFLVIQQVSSVNGNSVDALLHSAQAAAFLGFAGGTLAALWNLRLAFSSPDSVFARLLAALQVAAFVCMLYIASVYHMIGMSSQY